MTKELYTILDDRYTQVYTYFLTVRRQRNKVCKKFFVGTLALSEKKLRAAVNKLSDVGIVELENRGGRAECNQQRDTIIRQLVDAHIDRFPRIESHYCRQDTDIEYLSSDLTLSKMHRMFCKEQKDRQTSVSYTFYVKIFHEKNLSFHHPKKDQCTLCNTFTTGDQATKQRLRDKYDSHIKEKNKIRDIKKRCKEESLESALIASPVFDLEQVFSFPTFGHIKVNLFADGCPGQNKNTIIASMLLFFIRHSKNVNEISLRFFETNHGQNEGDSAHSAISTAMEAEGEILVPSEMPSIFAKARVENPYKVRSMNFNDFLDFKSYSKSLNILSVRKNDDGTGSINWTDIMEIRVTKADQTEFFIKIVTVQVSTSRSL